MKNYEKLKKFIRNIYLINGPILLSQFRTR